MKNFVLALLLSVAALPAAITYNIQVNPNLIGVPTGALDFMYNPGPTATQASTATVSNFSVLSGLNSPQITGDVTGDLTTSLSLTNSTGLNEYFILYTFPSVINFTVTFSGPAVDTPLPGSFSSGSTFAFSLYDDTGTIPQGSSNVAGFLFTIDLDTKGGTSMSTFTSGDTFVDYTVSVNAVPEPSTLALLPLSLGALCLLRKRR